MDTQAFKLMISSAVGEVSAKYTASDSPVCNLTLAHGAGAGMDHHFMEELATSLAEAGAAVLRFNFPFSEQGKRRPDSPAIAHQTIAAAIAKARTLNPHLPLIAAGKSFGGRMTSQYLAAHPDVGADGIVFYGFPLHPAGKPSTERAEHLRLVRIPMLFLQGSRDALATWALIQSVCNSLPLASLVRLEGADHSFKAGKNKLLPTLVSETLKWVSH
ncbi:alpha/beta hydrolase [Parapedobacter pyrenivorans]|uniref:Alpha/beta hydrolase n=1 Tax=Parapedobacter pyrenivorans TaxID=1305674 RepID=A0A917HHB0_9SPHI|nr:alpha/beta fold hydrolase [Parapedobacter pyrenivorans]GGG78621.1 alpha/beta hydrolase [Parapedobacter pyrenivorans]